MRYEEIIRKICGDDWRTASSQENEGGYGVACVLSFMRGAKANINEIAVHLGVPTDEIYVPFNRLSRAGVFTSWDVRKNKSLLSQCSDPDEPARAWAHIASLGGGFIGNF